MKQLTKEQMRRIMGGMFEDGCTVDGLELPEEGPCVDSTCKAKSTSSKSCRCNPSGDKCLCCTIIIS